MSTTQSILEAGRMAVRSRWRREVEEEWEWEMTVNRYGDSFQDADDTLCVCTKLLQSWLTLYDLMTIAHQAQRRQWWWLCNFECPKSHWTVHFKWLNYMIHELYLVSGSDSKESACSAGDPGLIPRSGRPPEKGMATHCSILAWEIPGGLHYSPWGHSQSWLSI